MIKNFLLIFILSHYMIDTLTLNSLQEIEKFAIWDSKAGYITTNRPYLEENYLALSNALETKIKINGVNALSADDINLLLLLITECNQTKQSIFFAESKEKRKLIADVYEIKSQNPILSWADALKDIKHKKLISEMRTLFVLWFSAYGIFHFIKNFYKPIIKKYVDKWFFTRTLQPETPHQKNESIVETHFWGYPEIKKKIISNYQ